MLLRAARPPIDARDRPERGSPYGPQQRTRNAECASHRQAELIYGPVRLTAGARSNDPQHTARRRGRRLASELHNRLIDCPRLFGECTKVSVDNPLVEARRADPQSVVHSNQSLSKITRREQIVKASGKVSPSQRSSMAESQRCGEGVSRLQRDGSRGEGLSRSVVTLAAHNTSFTLSRRYAPLATAGEVVGLWDRRWTPLRRPCGRLSGRRETMNVSRHWAQQSKARAVTDQIGRKVRLPLARVRAVSFSTCIRRWLNVQRSTSSK